MIIHKSIEIIDKNIFFFPFLINKKSTCFSSQHFLMHRLDIFLIFIIKNANANGTLFLDFVNVSNFDWKFYAFKIKFFSKIFISFCNSSWIIVCTIYVSDKTPFKAFIIISIFNINQGFSCLV